MTSTSGRSEILSEQSFSKPSSVAPRQKISRSHSTKISHPIDAKLLIDPDTQKKLDERRSKLIATIMLWSKNIFHRNVIWTSKAFYLWKFSNLTGSSDPDKHIRIGEQKNNYLQLFAENERLREQLNDTRRQTLANELKIRARGVKSMITIIFRSRLSSKSRYYFDRWVNNTSMIKLAENNREAQMKVDVGMQQIETSISHVRKTETINSQLKLTLVLTVYFYKWKSKTALSTLAEERKLYEQQRKIIYKDLLAIRETVKNANKQEVALLSTSIAKGDDIASNILNVKEQLNNVTAIYKNTGDVTNSINNNAAGYGNGSGSVTSSGSGSKRESRKASLSGSGSKSGQSKKQ